MAGLVIPLEGPRTCGSCTLCCKVLAIPEVPTERNAWCPHAQKGSGCGIYADRPNRCREFACLWLQGSLPPWARPDKIHGVVWMTADKVLQISEDPGYPRAASDTLAPLWGDWLAAGHYVTIVCGDDWRVQGTPQALTQVQTVQTAENPA